MKKYVYGFCLLLCLTPLIAFAQNGYIPWPAHEDTLLIPANIDTLNKIIARDTAGTGWQGANGPTAWKNGTRVFVLQANQTYWMTNFISVTAPGRALRIRAEYNKQYTIPTKKNLALDWRPRVVYSKLANGALPGYFVQLTKANDTLVLKNIAVSSYDEDGDPNMLDVIQGNMIYTSTNATNACIYLDSCFLHNINGQFFSVNTSAKVVRIQNTVIADGGFLGMSNFGAGRACDLRFSAVDTIDMNNNTFVNIQDRVLRHQMGTSNGPLKSVNFDHNTVVNAMSYGAMLTLGWIDSLGTGPFRITNNLFIDNFALGPDTDLNRQNECLESPDVNPDNNLPVSTWIVARKNNTTNVTPWVMAGNYYGISDSGAAIRSTYYPQHPGLYSNTEPILTSDLKKQLAANGGDTVNAFKKITIKPNFVPPLMTKMIRWYWAPLGAGSTSGSTPESIVGAGAGKIKTGSSGTPATYFYKLSTATGLGRWPYDYNRRYTSWYFDSLDCSYTSPTNLSGVSTDGKVIGDTRWTFSLTQVVTATFAPKTINFGTVAKNASKTDTVVVSSTGNSSLTVDSIKSSASEFTVSPTTAIIASGQSTKFVITYHPTTPGAKSGNLVFYHKGISQRDTVSVSGDVVAAAAFEASKTSFNFGTVEMGQNKKDSLVVTNHGTIDLSITSVASSNSMYAVSPTTATVTVEGQQKFYVTFTPTAEGVQNGKIAFNHNGLTHDTITVTGTGHNPNSVDNLGTGIPKTYDLHNNYPNPFNPTTTIRYDIPQESKVVLKVYSLLGQEVSTLVDGIQDAGYHQVIWNGQTNGGRQLASGMYLFRISAQSTDKSGRAFNQVKKMILLK